MDRPLIVIKRILIALSLVGLVLPLTPTEVYAAEKTAPKKKKKKSKKPKKGISEPVEDAPPPPTPSDAKRFEVLANAGLAPNPMLGFGATLGLFMGDGSSAIEGSLLTASKKYEVVSMASTVFGARYRKSFWTVPYVAAGLGLRTLTAKWNTLSANETEELASGASSTAVVLDIAFGGQIRFGSIALGADLVGVLFPVAKLSTSETVPDEGTYSTDDYATQKAVFDKQNGMNLVLFKVGIGFAF
jgi:hypothetical protein